MEPEEEEKIFEPCPGVLIGASGLTGIIDKFQRDVEERARLGRVQTLAEAVVQIEDSVAELKNRYGPRLDSVGKGLIECLVVGLRDLVTGPAQLQHLILDGYAEAINKTLLLGSGTDVAKPFVKALYRPDITTAEMIDVAVFSLHAVEELKLDEGVGGRPSVVVVQDVHEGHREPSEVFKRLSDGEIDEITERIRPAVQRLREILSPEGSRHA